MNICKFDLLFFISMLFLTSCVSVNSLSDHKLFNDLVGEQVKTNSEAVLYLRRERLFEKESPYFLYKSHDDKAMTRTVPLGSVISIIYISRYKTHEGGAWLGVSGEVINSNGTTDKFIYHWSDLNGVLNIAPWENIDTDRNRNVHNLLY